MRPPRPVGSPHVSARGAAAIPPPQITVRVGMREPSESDRVPGADLLDPRLEPESTPWPSSTDAA